MKVKLVSHTIACDDFDFIATPTELVAFCARVSNPSNQTNIDTTDKLVAYLIKHKHWSPFEMVNVTLEIETTRDIARQKAVDSVRQGDTDDIPWEECADIKEIMEPRDNDGFSTTEIFEDDGTYVWTNGKDKDE